MPKNLFKFLDSYTKEDKDIFFGRETEIEELYQKVFESKILLVCGVSGTGKSSLIDCGLANKFEDSDWLPINIRRGTDINDSLRAGISKLALTKVKESKSLTKQLQSLYLDHFKPIYLIFDQFEELFIFGSKEERKEFIKQIKTISKSDIQCKFVFAIREEYVAGVIEFDREIPDFLANRVRLEKMTWHNAKQVIEEPCKVYNIEVEKGFSETVLEKLSPESTEVELTYLQVFLDKAFRLAIDKNKEKPGFTNELFEQIGDVSDLLGSFLEEQISQLDDPDSGLVILKSFVSVKGTKRQITEEEIIDYSRTFGKEISPDTLKDIIQKFVNLRILRDKDENGRYELRHDGLATKIYEKITLVEKEMLEVRQFIDNAYSNYEKRNVYLSVEDLKYIALYENKLFLNKRMETFIEASKKEAEKSKRRKRNILVAATLALIIILSGFTIWAIKERGKAVKQKIIAQVQKNVAINANEEAEEARQLAEGNLKIAEQAKEDATMAKNKAKENERIATNAKEIVTQELYAAIKRSLTISNDALNILYVGIDNPISISASGVSPENLIITAENGSIIAGKVKIGNKEYEGNYIALPRVARVPFILYVKGISTKGDTINLGSKTFRVKTIPNPSVYFCGKRGGELSLGVVKAQVGMFVEMGIALEIIWEVESFSFIIIKDSNMLEKESFSYRITDEQKELMDMLENGDSFYFDNVIARGPDGRLRAISRAKYTISNKTSDDTQYFTDNRNRTKIAWRNKVQTYISKNDWDGLAQFINLNRQKFYYDDPELMNRLIEIIYKTANKPEILIEAEKWAL